MDENRILNEESIGDIILCEPITRNGKVALNNLGLTIDDINPSYFYNNLYVKSKYDHHRRYETKPIEEHSDDEHNYLYYQYTVDRIQFEETKERLRKFNSRFCSDTPNEYPLLMLGVAGNGKSIEVNKRIREITAGETEIECTRAYFDLEDSFTKITYGTTYKCPEQSPLWLFCIKLLDGIMRYINQCNSICTIIFQNFNQLVDKHNLADEELKKLFQVIRDFQDGNNDKETAVFNCLKDFLSDNNASNNIQNLLEILMWIMFCSDPTKKQYIVIDNIEQYIELNGAKIQIPNSDISVLYKSINLVVMNMTNAFSRIEKDLGWRAFKIIMVLRRTSIGLLDSTLLHSPVKAEQNIADITGYFQIPDIWVKKKEYIWDKKLKSRYSDTKNTDILGIVDYVMNDGSQAVGTDYQSIIAPLMSYGIRRNARAQAHAAYSTYQILTNNSAESINLDEFHKLMANASGDNSAIRYMFRRALIEFQFKWSIGYGNRERWSKLGIGHTAGEKKTKFLGNKFEVETVKYYAPEYVTLMRRILTCLSYFHDENGNHYRKQNKLVADMFSTISLFDLIKGVFINPRGDNTISDKDFSHLARVLIALSDMSNSETKCAPYIILGVNDKKFHTNTCESVLAEILKKIWNAKYECSLPGEIYNCSEYGVRITDAGYSFLLDWQASFSFMASLYCFTIPSLFFLKDITSINYVIETIYKASSDLCKMYEAEAKRFCGEHLSLCMGTYLLNHNNQPITFRCRVKDLHINHLRLYQDYIEKNYRILSISRNDMIDLTARDTGYISQYINKYSNWITTGGAPQCF